MVTFSDPVLMIMVAFSDPVLIIMVAFSDPVLIIMVAFSDPVLIIMVAFSDPVLIIMVAFSDPVLIIIRGVGTATATTAMAVPLFRLTPWHIIALKQKTTVVLASLVMTSTLRRKMTWHSSGADRDCIIIICVEKGVASRVIRVSV